MSMMACGILRTTGVPDLNATAASPVEEAPAGGKKKKKNKKKQPKEDPEMPTTQVCHCCSIRAVKWSAVWYAMQPLLVVVPQAAPIDEDVHGSVSQKVKELYNYDLPSSSTQDWWQMFSQTSLLRWLLALWPGTVALANRVGEGPNGFGLK